MYFTYILKSRKTGTYYVGSAADINRRLIEHNSGKARFTRTYIPWELYYHEQFTNRKDAVVRERQIKSWKKRAMIEKLVSRVEDPRFCKPDMVGNKIGTP